MRRRRLLIPTSLTAFAAVSMLAAGCGSSSPSSSTASSSSNQSNQSQSIQPAINFADCMRSHGVSDFPDPTTSAHGFKESLNPNTQHSPAFLAALRPCQHLLLLKGGNQSPPHTQAQIAGALAFARCIRTHGFPNFPDPTSTGDLSHAMLASAGINLHQPAVVQAADACVGVTHGFLTRTDVARFIAGQ